VQAPYAFGPQGRLADPRLALEDEDSEPAFRGDEGLDREQFSVATDDSTRCPVIQQDGDGR
jgi:hypothetical protein